MKDKISANQRRAAVVLAVIAALLAATAAWTLYRPDAPAEVRFMPAAAGSPYLLDLNDATEDELTCLPGVGPATAEAILARREELGAFRTREDVLSVPGIGEATYEKLEPYITY